MCVRTATAIENHDQKKRRKRRRTNAEKYGPGMTYVVVYLPIEERIRLRSIAKGRRLSLSALIRNSLSNFLVEQVNAER